ncbi:MAG: response regulator [Chitinophagaceae bacterium]|nr:MAG: response regulator [Chitinophagaceae bacterium]
MPTKVLFADDEEDIRYVTEILLTVAGYDVSLKHDTSFADDLDTADIPDIYLLDRHMNGADLLDTCKKIKTHPRTAKIPVIMVSADPKIKDLYKTALADDFVAKPFEKLQLLDAIARLLPR